MGLCIAAAASFARLGVATFTLAWIHTVEKIPWEEDWLVKQDYLVIDEVRIKGSGAGMEPPPEARLVDGWYVWHPEAETRDEVILRRAPQAGDWHLCTDADGCRALGAIVGEDADPVRLYPCE